MRTPTFWKHKNLLAIVLLPVATLYSLIVDGIRTCTTPKKYPIRIICVGNLVAGGAGKTPVALAIGKYLTAQGKNAHFLSRGYQGKLAGPVRVTALHTAQEVGDEPLLLAECLSTWVAKNRQQGADAALKDGVEIIVMDDGFQNPSLHKDISLLVIDGNYGLGNEYRIPAGPLRESIAGAMTRANAVILIGKDKHNIARYVPSQVPILHAHLNPTDVALALTGKPVVAFAGIAHPEKFYQTLKVIGCNIKHSVDFADHHFFTETDIAALHAKAKAMNARLVTTTKDYARLPTHWRTDVTPVPVEIVFEDEATLRKILSS